MNDSHLTTSSVVSFSQKLEHSLAQFYEALEGRFPQHASALRDFALESLKTGAQIVRTYQETVSDALETGFSFRGLTLEAYRVDTTLPECLSWTEALAQARALEETARTFYQDVAASSASLLASIPRTFKRAARRHQKRGEALEAMART